MPLSLFHLHGDLKDLRFPRLMAALREDDFTGVFQATTRPSGPPSGDDTGETTREVHFSSGHVAWAISTDKEESLRAYLLRNGTVTEARWAEAEDKARDGTLRQALIGLGIVNAKELTQIEKGRAEEIVLALFSARDGEYRVRERQLSPGTPDLRIDPRPLILKGVLEGGDRSLILDEVGSLDTVYVVKRPALEEPSLNLPGEFQSVIRHIDGKRSIAQICSLTSLPDYFVCSIFAALSMIGAVRRNYEKTQSKGRGDIVKGSEVAVQAAAAPTLARPAPQPPPHAAQPPSIAKPAPALELDLESETDVELEFESDISPEPEMHAEPETHAEPDRDIESDIDTEPGVGTESTGHTESDLDGEREPEPAPVAALESPMHPPISRRPFPEGQSLRLEAVLEEPEAESIYNPASAGDTSRPWFLLGGAAAVGFAALFLILMAQNPGDAGEVLRPVSEAALPHSTGPGTSLSGGATVPATPENEETRESPAPSAPVAPNRESNILKPAPNDDRAVPRSGGGRESLESGDYLAASRYFGREVTTRAGQYTIQLLTACQDETVRRAVDNARGSSDLFILSTRLEGRNCYRLFWGRYPTQTRAREALRRDVPSTFLQDRNQPRVTRIGG